MRKKYTIGFNNKTSFIPYHRTDEPYTNVLNKVLEDDRLSLLAIGIYTYILKFKNYFYDGRRYIIIKEVIQKRSGFGYDSFTKHWNLLVKYGYINAKRIKSGIEYEFIENPIKNTSNVNRVTAPTFGILTNSKKTNSKKTTIESKHLKKAISEKVLSPESLGPKGALTTNSIISERSSDVLLDQRDKTPDINLNKDCVQFDFGIEDLSQDPLIEVPDFLDETLTQL